MGEPQPGNRSSCLTYTEAAHFNEKSAQPRFDGRGNSQKNDGTDFVRPVQVSNARADRMRTVIRHLRRTTLLRHADGLSDGQVLGAFLERRDEAAFEALVRRLGPM